MAKKRAPNSLDRLPRLQKEKKPALPTFGYEARAALSVSCFGDTDGLIAALQAAGVQPYHTVFCTADIGDITQKKILLFDYRDAVKVRQALSTLGEASITHEDHKAHSWKPRGD